jgi:hypothetical protein
MLESSILFCRCVVRIRLSITRRSRAEAEHRDTAMLPGYLDRNRTIALTAASRASRSSGWR